MAKAKEKVEEVVESTEVEVPEVEEVVEEAPEEPAEEPKFKKRGRKKKESVKECDSDLACRKELGGNQGKIPVACYELRDGKVHCKTTTGVGYVFTVEQWNSGTPLS